MNTPNATGEIPNTKSNGHTSSESVSRRVADDLHGRLDRAVETGERMEKKLHESSTQAQAKARELSGTLSNMARNNPWAVIGGSVALGILIGALSGRR